MNHQNLFSGPILVTGAAGWLGSRLCMLLSKEGFDGIPALTGLFGSREVRGFDISEPSIKTRESCNVTWIQGDLRDKNSLSAFFSNATDGLLVHLAGVIHPTKVSDFYDVNVSGTENILLMAAKEKIRRVVLVSSNSPCGCNDNEHHVFNEDSPYNPYMNYGRSKMIMEQRARKIASETGLELVIVRAPWFYGPFQPPRQTLFFKMIKEGKMPLVGSGSNKRSMAYVDNLCQGLALSAVVPQAAGQTYWIADERPYPMTEIIETVANLLSVDFNMKVSKRTIQLPWVIGQLAQFIDGFLQSLGFYHQKIHVLSEMNKTIACNIAKAKRELGYQPRVDLKEGMRRSIKWVLESGHTI